MHAEANEAEPASNDVLLGLGLGSYAGSVIERRGTDARRALVICQALLIVGMAWSAYWIMVVLPDDDWDHDGWSTAQGDCNDCDPNANPGAYDVIGGLDGGPGQDEDCSGKADDEPTDKETFGQRFGRPFAPRRQRIAGCDRC